jgi:hypothetical protein
MSRFRVSSRAQCSICEHRLTVSQLSYFLSMADESVHNEILCRECMEAFLVLCPECSTRYTADGLCESCGGKAYSLVS